LETRRIIRATWYYLINNARYLKENFESLAGIFEEVVGEKNMSTMVEIWMAEGEARGEARGKAEAVLTILRTKFKKVPKRVESAIRQMIDPIALDSLTAYAVESKSLDEFATALQS